METPGAFGEQSMHDHEQEHRVPRGARPRVSPCHHDDYLRHKQGKSAHDPVRARAGGEHHSSGDDEAARQQPYQAPLTGDRLRELGSSA